MSANHHTRAPGSLAKTELHHGRLSISLTHQHQQEQQQQQQQHCPNQTISFPVTVPSYCGASVSISVWKTDAVVADPDDTGEGNKDEKLPEPWPPAPLPFACSSFCGRTILIAACALAAVRRTDAVVADPDPVDEDDKDGELPEPWPSPPLPWDEEPPPVEASAAPKEETSDAAAAIRAPKCRSHAAASRSLSSFHRDLNAAAAMVRATRMFPQRNAAALTSRKRQGVGCGGVSSTTRREDARHVRQ